LRIQGAQIKRQASARPMSFLRPRRQDTRLLRRINTSIRDQKRTIKHPDTRRKQQAKIISYRRARQIRAKGWSIGICQLFIDGKIAIEMTQEQVLMAWGKPDHIKRSEGGWGVYEQWIYGSTSLYFERGILNNYLERPELSTQ
jgi:hypothetical protein